MKIIRSLLLFLIIFVTTLFIGKGILAVASIGAPKADPIASSQLVVSPVISPNPEVKVPIRLEVPSLNINAESESVGIDDQGRMDVPKNVINVAWYELGVKPGQKGNAVFAGHFDKPDGSPAVFYDLDKLAQGDELIVKDETGKRLTFTVTEKRVVKLDEFPLEEVFGETDKIRVNLITCGGSWDKVKKEYSERTIIFSELKSS